MIGPPATVVDSWRGGDLSAGAVAGMPGRAVARDAAEDGTQHRRVASAGRLANVASVGRAERSEPRHHKGVPVTSSRHKLTRQGRRQYVSATNNRAQQTNNKLPGLAWLGPAYEGERRARTKTSASQCGFRF